MRQKPDAMKGYEPLEWGADSELDAEMQESVELMRRDLWRNGIRGENLERMAFEFGYVHYLSRGSGQKL